jgi:tetratricopeptide (TPR) repeat protein
MYLRDAKNDKAMECLTNALSCGMSNTVREKTLYQIAILYYEQDNHQKMLTHLESAYALNAQNPHINNTLAYYWATKGKNITKAHSFIEKALSTDTKNPYFLDTQAVILYKEKKYEQAQKILEPLADHNNGTILLHLAQVNYALNNKENADIFTKKAQPIVKNKKQKKALHKMQLLLTQT